MPPGIIKLGTASGTPITRRPWFHSVQCNVCLSSVSCVPLTVSRPGLSRRQCHVLHTHDPPPHLLLPPPCSARLRATGMSSLLSPPHLPLSERPHLTVTPGTPPFASHSHRAGKPLKDGHHSPSSLESSPIKSQILNQPTPASHLDAGKEAEGRHGSQGRVRQSPPRGVPGSPHVPTTAGK